MIGEALFLILSKLVTDPILQPESKISTGFAVSKLIGGDTAFTLLRCGLASEVLDTHNYSLNGAQSGNSADIVSTHQMARISASSTQSLAS
jgi:hypothetical protein